jgi:hypothetical protein
MTRVSHDRKREFYWLVLIGTMGYAFCLSHFRVNGRVWHEPCRWWDYAIDGLWTTSFIAASVTALRSDLRYRYPLAVILLVMIPWRLFWQSGRSQLVQALDLPVFFGLLWMSLVGVGGERVRARVRELSVWQWCVHLLVVLLLYGAVLSLVLLFLGYLPSFSDVTVHREDRVIVEELRRMATGAAIVSCLCGAILGGLVPVAWRHFRTQWRHMNKASQPTEPDAPPNGGPATPVGSSGVTQEPPSVS